MTQGDVPDREKPERGDDPGGRDPIDAVLRGLFERDDSSILVGVLTPGALTRHLDETHPSVLLHLGKSLAGLSELTLPVPPAAGGEAPGRHEGPRDEAAGPPEPRRASGDRFGRYRVVAEIGRGGIGIVYKAHDLDLGRDLAIKVLLGSQRGNEEALRRFVEEAQIGGQLQHPGIVPVHEMGLIGGETPYFTMKLVKGETLARLLDKRASLLEDRQRFLGIFSQICETLAYAHTRGVIHRDLKPSNIMVGAFSEVQVMDWGVAKVISDGGVHDEARSRRARAASQVSAIHTIRSDTPGSGSLAGQVMGTPAYMAPEQARGEAEDLDERCDVFGLGAILCEILTGVPPYVGESLEDVHRVAMEGRLEDAFKRLEGSGAGEEVTALARKCLSSEPRDRPRDAGSVARVLRAFLDSMDEKARAAELEAAEARVRAAGERRARRRVLALAVVAVAAVCAAGGIYIQVEANRARDAATATADVQAAIAQAADLRGSAKAAAVEDAPGRWADAAAAASRAVGLAGKEGVSDDVRLRAGDFLAEVRGGAEDAEKAAAVARRDRKTADRLEGTGTFEGEKFLSPRAPSTGESPAGPESGGKPAERERREEERDARRALEYGVAFEEYFGELGLDWKKAGSEERASGVRKAARAADLVRALDDWALALMRNPGTAPAVKGSERGPDGGSAEGSPPWKRVLGIARQADSDPLRAGIRAALEEGDGGKLKGFVPALPVRVYDQPGIPPARREEARRKREAAPKDATDVASPLTYLLLGKALLDVGAAKEALEVLRQGHMVHPADFWIHSAIALALATSRPPDFSGSIPHFSACVALRRSSPRAWFHLGAALEASGNPDDAAISFEEAARLAGDRPEASPLRWEVLARLGDALAEMGDLEGAAGAYRKRLESSPLDGACLAKLGGVLRRAGKLDEAAQVLRKAAETMPADRGAHLALGRILLVAGAPQDALPSLRLAAGLGPEDGEAQLDLGVACSRAGMLPDALAALEKACRLRPLDAKARFQLAVALGRSGKLEEAVGAFRESVRLGPDLEPVKSPSLWPGRAMDKLERDDLEAAESILARAIQKDPRDAGKSALLGAIKLRLGEPLEEAASCLEAALRLRPGDPFALGGLALARHRAGRPDEALEILDRCIESGGESRAARNNRAAVLQAKGRMAEAIAELRKAVELEPREPRALIHLGVLLFDQEKHGEAEKMFRAALEADGECAEAARQLGEALAKNSAYGAETFDHMLLPLATQRKALALDSLNPRTLWSLGVVLGDLGRTSQAVSWLEKSMALDPSFPRVHGAMGNFLLAKGAVEESLEASRTARRLNPRLWRPAANVGLACLELKKYPEAMDAFREAALADTASADPLAELLDLLEREDTDLGDAVARLVKSFDEVLRSGRGGDHRATEVFLLAWCRMPESLDARRPLEVAAREAERGGDPRSLWILGRVQRVAGKMREAVQTLEDAALLPTASPDITNDLEACRRSVLPDLLTHASIDAALDGPEALVSEGASWRYFRGGREPSGGLEWAGRDFDDKGWPEGPSPFGYRSGGLAGGTQLEEMPGSYTTVYLRSRFQLAAPERFERVLLSLEADDGFIAYANGVEVGRARAGKPGTRWPHDGVSESAAREPGEAAVLELPKDVLTLGENLVAIQGINCDREDLDFFLRPVVLGIRPSGGDAERLAAFRSSARGEDAPARLAYLEGRILQRAGKRDEAAKKFREVLAANPAEPLPLVRVMECLGDPREADEIFGYLRDKLKGSKLPARLRARPPERPVNSSPRGGARLEAPGTVLETTSFFSYDDRVTHSRTHWQIRAEGADHDLHPAFESATGKDLTVLTLPLGLLPPRTTYGFRASHRGSDGRKSDFSKETTFTTADYRWKPVSFDLAGRFQRDVIADAGDARNDAVEPGGGAFVVEGFDGRRADNPEVRGLPAGGALGVHRLGSYGDPNAILLTSRDKESLRIAAPLDRYACLRFLVASGRGPVLVPLVLEYEGGGKGEAAVACGDWLSTRPAEDLGEGSYPVLKGMSSFSVLEGRVSHGSQASLYESIVLVRADLRLVALELRPSEGRFAEPGAAFLLFAITGIEASEEP